MASHIWILLCCILFSMILDVQGLRCRLARNRGGRYCCSVRCSNRFSSRRSVSIQTEYISLYELTEKKTRTKLVSRAAEGETSLYLDSSIKSTVNASVSLTRYEADLSVDIVNENDCYRSFETEMVIWNLRGRKEYIRTIVVPEGEGDDCSCPNLKAQFARLLYRANEADRQKAVLRQISTDVNSDVSQLRQENDVREAELAKVRRNFTALDGAISMLKQNDKDTDEDIVSLRRSSQSSENAITRLLNSDKGQQDAIADLVRAQAAHDAEIKSLQETDARYQSNIAELLSNDAEISRGISDEIKNDIDQFGRLNALKNQRRAFSDQIAALRTQGNQIIADLNAVLRTEKYQDDAIADFRHQYEVYNGNVNDLQRASQAVQAAIADLQARDETHAAQISQLESADATQQSALNTARETYEANLEAVNDVRENDDAIDEIFTGLVHNDTVLQDQIDRLNEEHSVNQATVNTLQRNDALAEAQLVSVRQTNVALQQQSARASETYSRLVQAIYARAEQNNALRARIQDIERIVIYLRKTLLSLKVVTVTKSKTEVTATTREETISSES